MLDNNFGVTEDGTHILVPGRWVGAETVFVPVSLLVEMKKVSLPRLRLSLLNSWLVWIWLGKRFLFFMATGRIANG